MIERDIFVAIVAFALGAYIIFSAQTSQRVYLEFWLVKRLENRVGESWTRRIVTVLGGMIVMLGVAVLVYPSTTHRSDHSPVDYQLDRNLT